MIEVTDKNINKLANTLVLFHHDQCIACRSFKQLFKRHDNNGHRRLNFGMLNCMQYPLVASKYYVRSVPQIMLIHGGEVKRQFLPDINVFTDELSQIGAI